MTPLVAGSGITLFPEGNFELVEDFAKYRLGFIESGHVEGKLDDHQQPADDDNSENYSQGNTQYFGHYSLQFEF